MSGRDYPRLPVEEFARRTIEAGDLDPIYDALVRLRGDEEPSWGTSQIARWLVAYWGFYDCGFASLASARGGEDFWAILREAAENRTEPPVAGLARWPRGRERRHFRARIATVAIEGLRERYGAEPEAMVYRIAEAAPSYDAVVRAVRSHYGFGAWIAFKVADMLERVVGVSVEFAAPHLAFFDSPARGAIEVADSWSWTRTESSATTLAMVVRALEPVVGGYEAPGIPGRPCGVQEIETVLCKWKSHRSGHYPLYADLREIREKIEPWAGSSIAAQEFLGALRSAPE